MWVGLSGGLMSVGWFDECGFGGLLMAGHSGFCWGVGGLWWVHSGAEYFGKFGFEW